MDSIENRIEFFYYEDCEAAVAITHNQTIIGQDSYTEYTDKENNVMICKSNYLYLFNFVNLAQIDYWID